MTDNDRTGELDTAGLDTARLDTAGLADGIRIRQEGGILRISFARPERMNALDGAASIRFIDALEGLVGDSSVRVVVIAGEGGAFTTGADVTMLGESDEIDPQLIMDTAARVARAILHAPVPVIAKVNGPAVGMGVSIALSADIVIASEDAYFLLAFINVGLAPDTGASLLLPAAIGRARATALALLGEPLPAPEAASAGLIYQACPAAELDARVDNIARRLARGPRRALELTKQAMVGATLDLMDAALDRESRGQVELLRSEDFQEGVSALLQGRRAKFAQ